MPLPQTNERSMLWYVVALASAIALPLLSLSVVLASRWIGSEHRRLDTTALEIVDNAAAHVDQYIAGRIAMLQALATSPAFDSGDFRHIDRQARELLDLQGSTIVLRELDGQQRVNTRLPFSADLPKGTNVRADAAVLATKRPQVSDLYMGTASGGPLVRIVVPVIREGVVKMTLTASLPPEALRALLGASGVADPYSGVVVDRNGVVLASTDERVITGSASPTFALAHGERGHVQDGTGQAVLGFRRSGLSGWLVQVAVPKSSVDAPLRWSLLVFAGIASVLCLVAAAAAWRIGKLLVSSQRTIADAVECLELGRVVAPPRTFLREADRIGFALVDASARLRRQAELIESSRNALERRVEERTRQLSTQAEILSVTLENMDQGLVLVGADRRVSLANRRAGELADIAVGRLSDPIWAEPDGELATERLPNSLGVRKGHDRPSRTCLQRHEARVLEVRAVPLPSGGEVRTYTDVTDERRSGEMVRESEERLRLIAEHSSDMIVRSDLDTTRRYVSPACRALLGYEPSELVGTRPLDGVHPDDRDDYAAVLDDLSKCRVEVTSSQQRYRRKDGSWVWTEATFRLTRGPDGAADGYVASIRDVTTRKAVEEALRRSQERLAYALDSGSDGLWDRDLEHDRTWYSDRWHAMLGYAPGEIDGTRDAILAILHPDDLAETQARMREHLAGETAIYEVEHRLRNKSGSYSWVHVRGRVVERRSDGTPVRMVGTQIDIGARKRAEAQIRHLAGHDALTNLPNRAAFYDKVRLRLERQLEGGPGCAVLCLDLDRFKAVNDTYGHAAGDALLVQFASRLAELLGADDTFARIGGDEFHVLVDVADAQASVEALASRLIGAAAQPYRIEDDVAQVGLSVGIALAPEHGLDVGTVLRRADLALYRAKSGGRETFRVYEPEMDEAVESRRRLEVDLRAAVAARQFELHYQPIVDMVSDAVTGFEALVRWRHPTRGLVPPADFIPLAEETGLIVPIGEWVLRSAIEAASGWPAGVRVAVNISGVQFRHASLMRTIVSGLAEHRLHPRRLELEITESVLIADNASVLAQLLAFSDMGVCIALDDFGTGYSSLSYLQSFRFDRIKLDRRFVSRSDDPSTLAIIRAIVQLASSLGMATTAEGVETEEQAIRLKAEQCGEVQGYLFGRPMPGRELGAYLAPRSNERLVC